MRVLLIIALLSLALFAQEKNKPADQKPAFKPEVHLNHAFIVPDAKTYDAIRNSDFVKQFAVWEERTTHRKDITYTGFYLYGRHTYFEFLKPDERNPVGASKIAFGVDRSGDLDLLQKRAEAAGIKTEIKTITRAFNGKDVDWFRSLEEKDEKDSPLSVWTLEYVPTFLHQWDPPMVELGGVRREDVLQRYAQVVKQWPIKKPMVDIIGISIEMPEAEIAESLEECASLGLATERKENTASCSTGDQLIYITAGAKPGITSVQFRLSGPVHPVEYKIGTTHVCFVIDPNGARLMIWNFRRKCL